MQNNLTYQLIASVNTMEAQQDKGTVLLNAIESFAFTRAIELLRKEHSFSQDELNKALISACQLGHKFLIQTLVRTGANVHCKDTSGNTTLMLCAKNGFADVVRFLIEKQVDVNASNSTGDTALLLSVRPSGSTEITKLLLGQIGIQFYHQNKDGYTALMKAIEVRDVDTVKMLLDEYIKFKVYGMLGKIPSPSAWKNVMKATNHKRETAQDIAERCGLGSVFKLLSTPKNSKQKVNTSQQLMKTAMSMKDAKSFGTLLDCEFVYMNDVTYFNQLFRSMFQKCKKNTTKSFSESEVAIIKSLLECGADVNISWSDVSGWLVMFDINDENSKINDLSDFTERSCRVRTTPLNTAVKAGHCELVKLLLKYKADVNHWHFLNSALHHALRHGHIDCAKLLVQHGAKMHIMYALVSAVRYQIPHYMDFLCENYKDEIVSLLQKSNNLNAFVRSAVRGGNLRILRQIFNVGVDCSQVKIPLAESKDGSMAKFLIEQGADVNATKEDLRGNITPLLDVIINREYSSSTIDVIRVLLENGASTNDRDCNQETPLMIAASKEGCTSVLQLLLDHGADVSSTDIDGSTALIWAIMEDCSEGASFLIKFAKDRKDVLNAQNNKGLTALMAAAADERQELIRELLCEGADVTLKDNDGDTALLHYLSQVCVPDEELLLDLISAGSDVNWQNKDGLSPLMVASMNYLQEAVSVLLDSGADVNAVSEKDQTKTAISFIPVDSFLEVGAIFCMECLLDKGADASYLNQYFLPKLIINSGDILIPKLIRCGVGPSDIELDEVFPRSSAVGRLSVVSPLCLALLVGNVALAKYFVGNVYLTKSDVSSLTSNKDLQDFLDGTKKQECLDFLASFISQPRSLFTLSLVAVSSAVGSSPGRESRVNTLPVPEKIKHKLLFRTEDVKLVTPDDPVTDTLSQIGLQGLRFYLRHLIDDHSDDDDLDYDSEFSSSLSEDDLDYIFESGTHSHWSD